MAWLNAVPKPDPNSRRGKRPETHQKISRLEAMARQKIPAFLPPNPVPHLVDRLVEIGLTEAAGMGAGPISWATIDAWHRQTAVELLPWEARVLRRLSIAYVAESRRAESETCPPPWHAPVTQREIETEEQRLRLALG